MTKIDQRGAVQVTIAGKTYPAVFTFAKLNALESFTGKSIIQIAENATELRTVEIVEAICLGIEGAGGEADRQIQGELMVASGILNYVQSVSMLIACAISGPKVFEAQTGNGSTPATD